ncbi:DUF4255 domain-containing protein [Candidatus Bathyarchaeota archaeon]|nr:DUF4255 domain-containing protein [Candidatus Bathyarchaeota archaeon]
MSSYNNLNSVSKTLAGRIWNGIKGDKQIKTIINSEKQIIHLSPKDAQTESAQVSVFLYNITELSSMRNQPQTTPNSSKPPLYLNLRYLITPLTLNIENDQIVLLGKIMQLFSETPVLRGSDLQGSLSETGDDLRITLDALAADDLNKLWTMFSTPYKLCVSYTVYPVRIESSVKSERKTVIIKKPNLTIAKTTIKKA